MIFSSPFNNKLSLNLLKNSKITRRKTCGRKRKSINFSWQLSQTISCMCVQHNNLWIHGRDLLQVNFHYVTIMNHYSTPDIFICTDICSIKLNENSSFFYYFPLIALIIEIVMSGMQSNNFKFSHLNYWKEFLLSIDFAAFIIIASHKIF